MQYFSFVALVVSVFLAGAAASEPLRVITYNVESDRDTSVSDVAADVVEIGPADIWALQEVENVQDMFALREAMASTGRNMWFELGLSGGQDRLAIVFDQDRFEVIEGPEEITSIGGSRPPLRIRLADTTTDQTFNAIVNHLNRGNKDLRREQAKGLREWLTQTDEATITLGDFNFDLDVPTWAAGQPPRGNRAFHIFTMQPSPAIWLQHGPQISTQCSTEFDSVLDFIFVSGTARGWEAETELLFTDDQYCVDEATGGADHRPISATFDVPSVPESSPADAALIDEISRLREQLNSLEQMVRSQ